MCSFIYNPDNIYFRPNEIRCEVDIHLSVTVSSDSSVSVTPRIHCKNSDNSNTKTEVRQTKTMKKEWQRHERTNSNPGESRPRFGSI